MLRLLMLTSSYPRGEWDWRGGFVRDLGRALIREGIEVSVAAPRPAEPTEPLVREAGEPRVLWLPKWLPARAYGFHEWGLEAALARDAATWVRLPPFLMAFALEVRVFASIADVIVAHWLFPMGFVGALVARWADKPFGVVAHSGPPWPARLPPLFGVMRGVMGRSSSVACVSESVRREVTQVFREGHRIEVLPLGVDLRSSAEPRPLQGRVLRALFVGRLVQMKGVDLLVRAARRLGEAVEWTVIGDGPEASRLKAGAPPSMHFFGEMAPDRVRSEMPAHDVLVIPSRPALLGRAEGMPRVLFEAWSCGLPVIAADTGGLAHAIREHGGGLLFPADDLDGLLQRIALFRADADLRRRLRSEALRAASEYSWDRLGPRWAEWVRGLAG